MNILYLVIVIAAVFLILGYFLGKKLSQIEKEARKDAIQKSRSVLAGQFSEQLAPYLPDFPYSPTEVRFIGKPFDFLVFKGMDEKNISEVVFVEVKSGKSRLNPNERSLRDVINAKNVSWYEYKVPEGVTQALPIPVPPPNLPQQLAETETR